MGKKCAIFIPLMVLLGILQTSLFPHMKILNTIPNVVLVLVCTIAYFFGSEDGLIFGVVGGITLDILTAYTLGGNALLFALAGFVVGFFPRKNFWDKLPIALGIAMAAVFITQSIGYVMSRIGVYFAGDMQDFSLALVSFWLQKAVPGLLYNAIVFIPLYFICRTVDRHVEKGRQLMADF